jgi:hypothetical protein
MAQASEPTAAEHLDKPLDDQGELDLDDEELRALDEAIDMSDAQIARGETVPFEAVLGDVRRILRET